MGVMTLTGDHEFKGSGQPRRRCFVFDVAARGHVIHEEKG